MNLDTRIIDQSKIFPPTYNCAKFAEQYIGYDCFFGNKLKQFENLDLCNTGILIDIIPNDETPYICRCDNKKIQYGFFLPVVFTELTYEHSFVTMLKTRVNNILDSNLKLIQDYTNDQNYCETERHNLPVMMAMMTMYKNQLNSIKDDKEIVEYCRKLLGDYAYAKIKNEIDSLLIVDNVDNNEMKDILNSMKENKNPRSKSRNNLKDYMETLKDFYGEITVKTLKDSYDDSFEIIFYTDKIDDDIINTLEKYKDYQVYDVHCEQYCSFPPVDRRIITLDNRKRKP